MAKTSENLQTLATAKANIKSAIEAKGQDLTNVPFTKYGEKISAISGGAGGECDLIDVFELPTENVDESKVYRIKANNAVDLWFYIGEEKVKIVDVVVQQGGVAKTYYVDSIDDVTEPKITDFENDVLYIYIIKDTFTSYIFIDETTYETLAGFMGVPDNGIVANPSDITSFGMYTVVRASDTIGVPEMSENKHIYTYNGIQWVNTAGQKDIIDMASFFNSKLLKNVVNDILDIEIEHNETIPFEKLIVPVCDTSYMKEYTQVDLSSFRDITSKSILKEVIIDVQVADTPGFSLFVWCNALEIINFRGCTKVPEIQLDMEQLPSNFKVFVPDKLYDEWIASRRAQHYVDHIYKLSDMQQS